MFRMAFNVCEDILERFPDFIPAHEKMLMFMSALAEEHEAEILKHLRIIVGHKLDEHAGLSPLTLLMIYSLIGSANDAISAEAAGMFERIYADVPQEGLVKCLKFALQHNDQKNVVCKEKLGKNALEIIELAEK
jgi:hypothetical protein